MSVLSKFLAGFHFRTSRPHFQAGERLHAFVTGYDRSTGDGIVRIGDSVLRVKNASREWTNQLVELEVVTFDTGEGTGLAELVGPPPTD